MSTNSEHPVWQVYDQYRTARLNVYYNTDRRELSENLNKWIDIVLAILAPGTTIAGLAIWSDEYGKLIWSGLMILTSLIAAVKPFLKLSQRIMDLDKIISGYRSYEIDLELLKVKIEQDRCYNDSHKQEFRNILSKKYKLLELESHSKANDKLIKQYSNKVICELPATSFFVPEE